MPFLYGSGKPIRNPGWVTGSETPSQRDKRFRDINDALEKNRKREEERRNRELFRRVEQQGDVKFSPPSPPMSRDLHTPYPTDVPFMTRLGTQDRFESFLDRRLEGYEATFGMTPLFGSQAYSSAENMAREDWREEQKHVPDDLVTQREAGISLPFGRLGPVGTGPNLFERSRALRAETDRPPPDVDSKYDILIDSITADVAAGFKGVPEPEALRLAGDAVDEWLKELEAETREDLGKGTNDQIVREQMYRTLRVQEHISDILDEWSVTDEARQDPPLPIIDEALRREAEENGDFFKDFPDRKGLLESITSLFSKRWIPAVLVPGLTPRDELGFLSLDDVHRMGQAEVADPIAGLLLRGEIAAPEVAVTQGKTLETKTGVAGAARAVELGVEAVTGIETDVVSSALQSQLAEDIVSEVISPEYVSIAMPFGAVGTARFASPTAKIIKITANLLGTGLEPNLVRGTFRGLSAFARDPRVLSQIPKAVRESEFFLRGVEGIRAARASVFGRGLSHEEWVKAVGATDDLKFRRVTEDLSKSRPSAVDDLPLRQAVEEDLTNGRSMEDVIETGLAPRPTDATGFWGRLLQEEAGAVRLPSRMDDTAIVGRALTRVAAGDHPGSSLHKLRRSVNATLTDTLAPEMLDIATTSDLVALARANRIDTAALAKMSSADLKDLASTVLHQSEVIGASDKALKTKLRAMARAAKGVRTRLEHGAFPELARAMRPPTSTANRAQAHLFAAFDPELTMGVREKELNKFTEVLNAEKAKTKDPFLRQVYTEDAAFAEWSFRMQNVTDFKDPIWVAGQEEVVDMLKTLTAGHRGSIEQRLAKLPVDTADELTKDVRAHIRALGGTLEEDAKRGFTERLTTMRLDMHDASVLGKPEYRFDAGRRFKVLIESSGADQVDIDRSFKALASFVEGGKAPPGEFLKSLERTLGPDAVRELMKARKLSERGMEVFYDVMGLPRVLMATMDMSALLRQGGVLAPGHPFIWGGAAKDALLSFFNEKHAIRLNEALKAGRGTVRLAGKNVDLYELGERMGLYLAPWEATGTTVRIAEREEAIMTRLASMIPGVRMSERSYILFLNKLRADVFDFTIRSWAKSGRAPSENEMRQIAHFVNVASGRGSTEMLPSALRGLLPFMNVTKYSPRLAISRFQVVGATGRALMTPSSRASQMIIKDMTAFMGAGLTPLTLGYLGGLWDLEFDPTSADFGKIRVGNTSIDPWAGFRPYVTYFARMTEAIAKGEPGRLDEIIEQLARSKLAPVASGALDAVTGRDFLGRPVKWNTLDFDNIFISRVVPLIAQDVKDALEEAEFKILEPSIAGVGAFLGLGAATYRRPGEERTELRNEVSQDMWGLDYGDKDVDQAKRDVVDNDPRIADLTEEIRRDALERDREWAKNVDEEERELLSIRTTGLDLSGKKVTEFTQKQIDDALDRGDIDGGTWTGANKQIGRDLHTWRQAWQEAKGIDYEEDPPEPGSLEATIQAWWDVEPQIDPFSLEEDWDTFFAEKEELEAQAISMQEKDEVTKYFEAMGEDDTDMQKRHDKARDQRDTLMDDMPKYMGGVGEAETNKLLDSTKEYLLSVGSSWGVARYIQWLYYQGEAYQTNEWAVAYWVALGERDMVVDPKNTQFVMQNPDMVMFYSGLFRGMTDQGKQSFVSRYGTNFLSKKLIEEFIDTGEISQQAEPELFQSRPIFQ